MMWQCWHCEHWQPARCEKSRKVWPHGSSENCRDFYRAVGTDDDLGDTLEVDKGEG